MINIIIADDHRMFIDGLVSMLVNETDIAILGEAANGNEVMKLLATHKPDIVLLDINMPEMNGIDATTLIRKKHPAVKILILTMYKTKGFINGLMKTGASGYVLKNTGQHELLEAIRTLAAGGTFFSCEVAETITQKNSKYTVEDEVTLSKREIEIIKEIANGLTSRQISEKFSVSYFTIETHRKNILNKLGLNNVAELIRYAAESGIL